MNSNRARLYNRAISLNYHDIIAPIAAYTLPNNNNFNTASASNGPETAITPTPTFMTTVGPELSYSNPVL